MDGLDMPYDPDVIARLYPANPDGFAHDVICNHRGHIPARRPAPARTSRESTVELDEDRNPIDELPYIEFRFSQPPRSSLGFVFGTGPNSDVVLKDRKGYARSRLSRSHFALTYNNAFRDGHSRLVVRDLESLHGTTVTYDTKGKDRRRKFDWTVSGPGIPVRVRTLIIQPDPWLTFRLIVMHHNIASPAYNASIQMFRRGGAPAMDLLGGLGFENGPETERQTGVHTPVKDPIFIEREVIAKSGSTIVTRYWDVSSGEEYVCKSPAGARYDTRDWEGQIRAMGKVSHEHIVRLCRSVLRPTPRLYLEYMPLGNLEEEHQRRRFSPLESLIVLRQTLSALSYLHQPQRELAHGQINPCNVLVKYRDAGDIRGHLHVKLSDFGSYRGMCSAQDLETYITPEEEESGMMTGDIWALGIVIFELVYELPTRRGLSHLEWCHKVVAKVNSERPSALINILQKMLTIDPTARVSASVCLNEASRELNRFQSRSVTPSHASQAGNGKGKERDIGSPQRPLNPPLLGHYQDTPEDFSLQGILDTGFGHDFLPPQNLFSPADPFDLPQGYFDLPANAFSPAVGHSGPANEAGYEGGPVQHFQPDQPALPSPGDVFLPEAGVPGVPSPSPFCSVELFDRYGEVGEEKMLRRLPNNDMAAIYNPIQRTVNLTSVLRGLRAGHKSHNRLIQAVTADTDTRVLRKTRVPGATGTWITFDRALRLADSADSLPHLKEVILAASRAI